LQLVVVGVVGVEHIAGFSNVESGALGEPRFTKKGPPTQTSRGSIDRE